MIPQLLPSPEEMPHGKFKVDWTLSIPNVIAIVGVIASFAYSQAAVNGRIDNLQLQQMITERHLKEMKEEAMSERRDLQVQVLYLTRSIEKLVGQHEAFINGRRDK